jgi:hypothetical protein
VSNGSTAVAQVFAWATKIGMFDFTCSISMIGDGSAYNVVFGDGGSSLSESYQVKKWIGTGPDLESAMVDAQNKTYQTLKGISDTLVSLLSL